MMRAYVELVCRDKQGRLLWRYRRRSKSYVIALMGAWAAQMSALAASPWTLQDTGGAWRTMGCHQYNFQCNAGATASYWGIVVGTGVGAVAPGNYALATQIAHGVGAGQLSYGACSVGTPTIAGAQSTLTVSRPFTNGSGGAITINEIGLYIHARESTVGSARYFCMIRDLVVPGKLVNPGAVVTATYNLVATA